MGTLGPDRMQRKCNGKRTYLAKAERIETSETPGRINRKEKFRMTNASTPKRPRKRRNRAVVDLRRWAADHDREDIVRYFERVEDARFHADAAQLDSELEALEKAISQRPGEATSAAAPLAAEKGATCKSVSASSPTKAENNEDAAIRQGCENMFMRLLEQCADTNTKFPATSYAEAIENFKLIAQFPRFLPGPEQSARVRECLMPLSFDLYRLAYMLAEDGDDPETDTLAAAGIG